MNFAPEEFESKIHNFEAAAAWQMIYVSYRRFYQRIDFRIENDTSFYFCFRSFPLALSLLLSNFISRVLHYCSVQIDFDGDLK